MTHYLALVKEEEGKAFGVWFPDLPGCVSAGDSLDEAMENASEALALWIDVAKKHGLSIPQPRSFSELKRDLAIAEEMRQYIVAPIPLDAARAAAE